MQKHASLATRIPCIYVLTYYFICKIKDACKNMVLRRGFHRNHLSNNSAQLPTCLCTCEKCGPYEPVSSYLAEDITGYKSNKPTDENLCIRLWNWCNVKQPIFSTTALVTFTGASTWRPCFKWQCDLNRSVITQTGILQQCFETPK